MKRLLYWVFLYVPDAVLYRLLSVAAFLRSVYRIMAHIRMDVKLYSGSRGGEQVTMLWIGTSELRGYILDRLYESAPQERTLRRTTLLGLDRMVSDLSPRCDLVYVERSSLLPALKGFRRIKQAVDMRARIAPNLHRGKAYRQARNQANRYGIVYREYPISKHSDKLRLFYEQLYKPYISSRHGRDSVESFDAMRTFYAKGVLLLAYREGEAIAGLVLLARGNVLMGCKYGIRAPDDQVHRWVAPHYPSLKYAEDHDFTIYDVFHAKPFLSDGIFRNKRSWQMEAHIEKRNYYFDRDLYVRVVRHCPGVIGFMREHPFLSVEDGQLIANLVCRSGTVNLADEVVDQYRMFATGGIARYDFAVDRLPTEQERDQIIQACRLGIESDTVTFQEYCDLEQRPSDLYDPAGPSRSVSI